MHFGWRNFWSIKDQQNVFYDCPPHSKLSVEKKWPSTCVYSKESLKSMTKAEDLLTGTHLYVVQFGISKSKRSGPIVIRFYCCARASW